MFTIFVDGPKPNIIMRCLNALALMNMQDIASADINSDLVNDYFITRPIGLTTWNSWKGLLPPGYFLCVDY